MAKAELAKTAVIAAEGKESFVEFRFLSETTAPLFARLSDLPEAIREKLALQGLRAFVQRSYQNAATPVDAAEQASAAYESLQMGILLEGRGESPYWILAISEILGIDKAKAAERWQAMDDATRKAIKEDARVAAARARLMAEAAEKKAKATKPAESVDLGALFK